jgi:hypothetical protein
MYVFITAKDAYLGHHPKDILMHVIMNLSKTAYVE